MPNTFNISIVCINLMIIFVIVFQRLEDLLARSAERDPDALDAKSNNYVGYL